MVLSPACRFNSRLLWCLNLRVFQNLCFLFQIDGIVILVVFLILIDSFLISLRVYRSRLNQ
jgi:hypothetical protein